MANTSAGCRRHRGLTWAPTWALVRMLAWIPALASGGCFGPAAVPDQSAFASLDDLAAVDEAVVRVYVAPFPGLEGIAIHPWFVIRPQGGAAFDRWEVWPTASAEHGYVRKNLATPEWDLGRGGVFVLAELRGAEAERVRSFIEDQSPRYPCRDRYLYFPGPNSNTYARWVLDGVGWEVPMPPAAVGSAWVSFCR